MCKHCILSKKDKEWVRKVLAGELPMPEPNYFILEWVKKHILNVEEGGPGKSSENPVGSEKKEKDG